MYKVMFCLWYLQSFNHGHSQIPPFLNICLLRNFTSRKLYTEQNEWIHPRSKVCLYSSVCSLLVKPLKRLIFGISFLRYYILLAYIPKKSEYLHVTVFLKKKTESNCKLYPTSTEWENTTQDTYHLKSINNTSKHKGGSKKYIATFDSKLFATPLRNTHHNSLELADKSTHQSTHQDHRNEPGSPTHRWPAGQAP